LTVAHYTAAGMPAQEPNPSMVIRQS
jgi:hypothetical protein